MKKKIKVIWFCNVKFSDFESNATGTWLHTMAHALVDSGEIQLFNISQGKVKNTIQQNYNSIFQWIVPCKSLKNNGLPSSKTIIEIQKIVDEIKPDIIHIWGTESYWGLLSARGYIKGNIILEIQGLKFTIAKYFYSGLSLFDIANCFGFKEFVKPYVSLIGLKYSFNHWGKFEKEMLSKHRIISTQSNWVRAYVRNVNPLAQILNTSISLRTDFIESNKWDADNCVLFQIFTSISSVVSYKGLHILIDAIAILKKQYPQIRLCIAGSIKTGFRQDGYSKWLKKKIQHFGINENIFWLGSLDAKNIVLQMHKANVVVVPSFVESYCLALEEALTVGVPTVASFSGAMPELATHKKTVLFFPPGDAAMCANAIETFFVNKEYAKIVSENVYNEKNEKKRMNIADLQISNYRNLLLIN
ncbi:MAG: glycosyltransferase [Bacteroidetes bacterium]|nr:glycosyltransferase [Bacteroidota bacterium]